MKKWIRRIMLTICTLLVLAVLLSTISVTLFRSAPDWYEPIGLSQADVDAAAQRMINKLASVQNFAASTAASARRAALNLTHGRTPPAPPTSGPPGFDAMMTSTTVSFSEDELNAFFEKWSKLYGWANAYGKVASDPVIRLRDGHLILAGKVKDLGTVASLHFLPTIEPDGKLRLKLDSVLGGRLPLPQSLLSGYTGAVENKINQRLPAWQRDARIDPIGIANEAAICAAMGQLGLATLHDKTADGVLFLPTIDGGSVPMTLNAVTIADKTLTLTVTPMAEADRAALLERLQKPADKPND